MQLLINDLKATFKYIQIVVLMLIINTVLCLIVYFILKASIPIDPAYLIETVYW